MNCLEATAVQAFSLLNQVERKNAPSALFIMGESNLLPKVSIEGSRKASLPTGKEFREEWS